MNLKDPRPDARATLLLRAALLRGDEARDAWTAWRADANLDRIDQATFRLLPLVYRNLERLGVVDAWDGALRGFYRRAWCENQLLFRRLAVVLATLAEAGIDVLVLKGAALASQAYDDAGARPMADVDMLVRRRDFADAIRRLGREGWTPSDEEAGRLQVTAPEAFRDRYNALGLQQPADRLPVIDLHDRLLHVYGRHRVDFPEERLFADAETFDLAGAAARRLSPGHALLHVCFHGFQRQHVSPIRWIADTDQLLRAEGSRLRWDRLLDDARRARVLSPLRDALEFVATEFGTPVPAAVLTALRRHRIAPVERFERALRLGAPAVVADYGRSIAPALRRIRSRDPLQWPSPARLVREAWRFAYKLPRRHARRAWNDRPIPSEPRP